MAMANRTATNTRVFGDSRVETRNAIPRMIEYTKRSPSTTRNVHHRICPQLGGSRYAVRLIETSCQMRSSGSREPPPPLTAEPRPHTPHNTGRRMFVRYRPG